MTTEVREDVARLGVRLIIQTALEAEVEVFLGRARYQRCAGVEDTRAGSRAEMVYEPRPAHAQQLSLFMWVSAGQGQVPGHVIAVTGVPPGNMADGEISARARGSWRRRVAPWAGIHARA
jgi:hypothetical protein